MKAGLGKHLSREKGQGAVEFALILPILILLCLVPVDFFRYANTKMTLNSAASEAISQLDYAVLQSGGAGASVMNVVRDTYGDRLDTGRVKVEQLDYTLKKGHDYTYYVYTSDKANPDPAQFGSQFDERPSNYTTEQVNLQLSYEMQSLTFWGAMFLGSDFEIKTNVYSRSVYAGGYEVHP